MVSEDFDRYMLELIMPLMLPPSVLDKITPTFSQPVERGTLISFPSRLSYYFFKLFSLTYSLYHHYYSLSIGLCFFLTYFIQCIEELPPSLVRAVFFFFGPPTYFERLCFSSYIFHEWAPLAYPSPPLFSRMHQKPLAKPQTLMLTR